MEQSSLQLTNMDDLKNKLLSLTDQELRNYLEASGGYDGTPVTPSTRMLLVRKLTRNLLKSSSTDDVPGIDTSKNDSSYNEDTTDHLLHKDNDVKPNLGCSDTTEQDLKVLYFGIYFPAKHNPSLTIGPSKLQHVFTDKKELMKCMKECPQARFKVFQTRSEAEEFSSQGAKTVPQAIEPDTSVKDCNTPSVASGEKSAFKAPHHQELIQLRKIIERGDTAKFHENVWRNPRYLVSSGDTPTILQEGSRYNALHVASKAGNGAMCKAILETICSPSFIHLLYNGADQSSNRDSSMPGVPKTEDKAITDCMAYLLDLYLNTPEKGLNETPLHFACKFGKVEAVRVLLSYPMCDRTRPNKLGETAEEIICSRAGKGNDIEKEIRQIIKDCFYVPVMRPGDFSMQASVGDPFSPEKLPTPPAVGDDPKSSTLEINAFAGPMNLEKAQEFCLKLKSSRKVKTCEYPCLMSPNKRLTSPRSYSSSGSPLRLRDPERGLEREGRALADEFQVGWKEYWPFLGEYTNLTSREGMQALEKYLHNKLMNAYNLKKQSQEEENEKERTSTVLNCSETDCGSPKEKNLISDQVTPVSDLCLAMGSCSLSSNEKLSEKINHPSKNSACSNLADPQPCASPSPLQYVEKSCCVFARRISDLIMREASGGSNRALFSALGLEVNHLCRLVSSFKEDPRFLSVNFSCMHFRVAELAANEVLASLALSSISKVLSSLESMLACSSHQCSSSDEEEERYLEKEGDSQIGGREWRMSMRHGLAKNEGVRIEDKMKHGHCLLSLIKEALEEKSKYKDPICSKAEEANQIESAWAEVKPCSCSWPKSSQHHAKGSSRATVATVVRRLCFEKLSVEEGDSEYISSESSGNLNNQMPCNISHQAGDDIQKINYSEHNQDGDESDSSEFYTPPSSPKPTDSPLCSSDDDDEEMVDTEEIPRVFIGGEHPTKQDLDVLYALGDAEKINTQEFPLIYQWRHLVLLHTTEERESWPSPLSPRWKRQCGKADICAEKSILRRVYPYKSPTGAYLLGHQ